MYEEQDQSMFHIPVSKLALEAQRAAIEEQKIDVTTPIVIERAFPSYSAASPETNLYNELSAISDEVIACRNSVLRNIY